MRNIALSIAMAVLGTGCVATDEPCTNTILLYWMDRLSDEWGRPQSCGSLGLNYVDVFDGPNRLGRFACTDDYAILKVEAATYDLRVEAGYQGVGDTVIARGFVTVDASACRVEEILAYAYPGRGLLSVTYAIEGANQCQASPATYMWYSLTDDNSGTVAYGIGASSTSAQQTSIPCGTQLAVMGVPYGRYTLALLQEVEAPTTAPSVVSATLAPASATVSVPSTPTPLDVTLYYP